jgi:hypothetical protein
MSEAYQAYTIYLFEVDETQYAITDWTPGKWSLDIEETRKNGQEDTHCKATVVQSFDGDRSSYIYEDETISDYTSDQHAANVLAYINANPFYEDC